MFYRREAQPSREISTWGFLTVNILFLLLASLIKLCHGFDCDNVEQFPTTQSAYFARVSAYHGAFANPKPSHTCMQREAILTDHVHSSFILHEANARISRGPHTRQNYNILFATLWNAFVCYAAEDKAVAHACTWLVVVKFWRLCTWKLSTVLTSIAGNSNLF